MLGKLPKPFAESIKQKERQITTVRHPFLPGQTKSCPIFELKESPKIETGASTSSYKEHEYLGRFLCNLCDLEFCSELELNNHKTEHEKCLVEGCNFTGHPAVISKHYEDEHNQGLYDKIKKLNTPEEIEKWCQERRKKYPTKENIELRRRANEERLKRGEKLKDSKRRFGREKDKRSMQCEVRKKSNNCKNKKYKKNKITEKAPETTLKASIIDTKTEIESDDESKRILPMFKGTSGLLDYTRPKSKPENLNILQEFLGMYGSDSSEDENDIITNPDNRLIASSEISKNKIETSRLNDNYDSGLNTSQNNESLKCDEEHLGEPNNMSTTDILLPMKESNAEQMISNNTESLVEDSDNDMPEETSFTKTIENLEENICESKIDENNKLQQHKRTRTRKSKRKSLNEDLKTEQKITKKPLLSLMKKRIRSQNTMLEKLLQNEIRHERNVLLQCVRFVVENNFFDIGNNK